MVEAAPNFPQADLQDLVMFIDQTDDSLRYDVFYYLFTQLNDEELESLRALLRNGNQAGLLETLVDAEKGWKDYGISMGTISKAAPESEHLMFHLGRTKYFSLKNRGGLMGVPNYYGFGVEYWNSIKKELREAICSPSRRYSKDRTQFAEIGRTSITVGVPAIMAALSLPPSLAGMAIVLSVFISKVGVNAFCRMVNDEAARASTDEKAKKDGAA